MVTANFANKMPEKHGIVEGHVLGQIIFKMCTVDTRHADSFGHRRVMAQGRKT